MLKPRWSIEQKRQYVAKTAVRGVSAMVWRRLKVAADTSLAALHFIIRIIQGWGDDHLHQFHIYGKGYDEALTFRIIRSGS